MNALVAIVANCRISSGWISYGLQIQKQIVNHQTRLCKICSYSGSVRFAAQRGVQGKSSARHPSGADLLYCRIAFGNGSKSLKTKDETTPSRLKIALWKPFPL